MPAGRALARLAQLLHLAVPADELGQPSGGRRLESRPDRPSPGHLVDVDRLAQPLDRHEAQRFHLDVALGESEPLGRQKDGAGRGHPLHPTGQVGRL